MTTDNLNSNNSTTGAAEITISDLLQKVKEWFVYLRSKWLSIFLAGCLGGIIAFTIAYFQQTYYTASLTFALEDEKSGSSSGFGSALGLASQFGLDVNADAGGAFSASNLMELMKSRNLVEKTLLNRISVNGQIMSLADYYIQFKGLREKWEKMPDLQQLHLPADGDRTQFTRKQDSILGVIYTDLLNKSLTVFQKDKKVTFLTVEVKSESELFSKNFSEILAREVSEFYIETKSRRAKLNMLILQRQTDSVRGELNGAISGVASANDNTYNLNPALNVNRVPSSKRQVDVQVNTAILTQLVQNLELAKVSLRKETPLIQVIDKPIYPLKKDRPAKFKFLVTGGVIAALLMMIILITRRFLKLLDK